MKRLLAIVSAVMLAACANTVDRTPDRHETADVARTVGKVAYTPVMLVFGVVTWPLGLVGVPMAICEGDPASALQFAGWPFTVTYIFWVMDE